MATLRSYVVAPGEKPHVRSCRNVGKNVSIDLGCHVILGMQPLKEELHALLQVIHHLPVLNQNEGQSSFSDFLISDTFKLVLNNWDGELMCLLVCRPSL